MARRVFFSFDYDNVVDFRANVVRNHWVTKDREAAGFFDASVWEAAKKESDVAIKRLINNELKETSVTCVLIGTDTFQSRWVRYEVFKSIIKGNNTLGVHINKIKDNESKIDPYGPNPFDYLGLAFSNDGWYAQPMEFKKKEWGNSLDVDRYKLEKQKPLKQRGNFFTLKQLGHPTYCWIKDDGYNNFSKWVK